MIDLVCRRYGISPPEVLEWTPEQLTFTYLVFKAGEGASARRIKQLGGTVFPVKEV